MASAGREHALSCQPASRKRSGLPAFAWPSIISGCLFSFPTSAHDPSVSSPAPDARVNIISERRTRENAVTAADDAFGVEVGRERLGLYDSDNVRGFSPVAAGNARIDGLYFDPIYSPNTRITDATTIRVGIAAQGYPFITPTGIVDYTLRKPGAKPSLSLLADGDGFGTRSIEADGTLPLVGSTLSIGTGGFAGRVGYVDGTYQHEVDLGLQLRWRPNPSVEIAPFWTQTEITDAESSPIYIPEQEALPIALPRGRFFGPFWPRVHQIADVTGTTARIDLAQRLRLSIGLFHSAITTPVNFSSLRTNLDAAGRYEQFIVADPRHRESSDSGEIRLTRELDAGALRQRVLVSLRGRDRAEDFGGSDSVDLGRYVLGQAVDASKPSFVFTATSRDRVRQWTGGAAYQGEWQGKIDLDVSLVRTEYRKRVVAPDFPDVTSKASPWLLSVASTVHLTKTLSAYASYAEGLEDSAIAPDVAVNRGEPVPATRTRQVDGGLRWAITHGVTALIGLFDLKKPYFNLDPSNRYVRFGSIDNKGIELSVTGKLTDRLNIVFGTLLQRPRDTGESVAAGLVGKRPVGILSRISILDMDWKVPGLSGVSTDILVGSRSKEITSIDDRVAIPARTTVDLGARYRFKLGDHAALVRATVANVGDVRGLMSEGAGAYEPLPGRLVSAYLTIDI